MVVFQLPEPFTEDFIALIPEQRFVIDQMMNESKIASYTLTFDRSTLWCIVNANSEIEVVNLLNEFPLIDYMNYEISELMFHQQAAVQVPAFSLN